MLEKNTDLKEVIAMLVNCSDAKLPLVVEILRESGYELSDKVVAHALGNDDANERGKKEKSRKNENTHYKWDRTPYVVARRQEQLQSVRWEPTDNVAICALRKAYADGLRFSRIAEICDIGRKQPYLYMHGISKPRGFMIRDILDAIDQVYAEQGITKSE